MQSAMGPYLPEIVQLKCIHGNVREYPTVMVWLQMDVKEVCLDQSLVLTPMATALIICGM